MIKGDSVQVNLVTYLVAAVLLGMDFYFDWHVICSEHPLIAFQFIHSAVVKHLYWEVRLDNLAAVHA